MFAGIFVANAVRTIDDITSASGARFLPFDLTSITGFTFFEASESAKSPDRYPEIK
jgi:hypothetical protein